MRKIIFTLLVFFLGFISASAATFEFSGGNKGTLVAGAKQSYEVIGKFADTDTNIDTIEFDVDYEPSLIEYEPTPDNNLGYKTICNGKNVMISKVSKEFESGAVFTFNLDNIAETRTNATISIVNIKINGELLPSESNYYNKTLSLKPSATTTAAPKNTSAKITGIKTNNKSIVELKPDFDPNVKEYKIYIKKDTISNVTIYPTFEEAGATLKTTCTLGCSLVDFESMQNVNISNLIIGKNEVEMIITSEDGKNTETYKFIIYRGETTDGSNLLSDLAISDYNINEKFDSNILDYTASVPYEVENVKINAVPLDSAATVQIKGGENLVVGENTITITVTPTEDETNVKIYNITLIREDFVPEEPTTGVAGKSKSNNIVVVAIIGGGLLIIGLSAYFIFFYKGKKNKLPKMKPEAQESTITKVFDEDKEPTSVDDALNDLMKTKELKVHDFKDPYDE